MTERGAGLRGIAGVDEAGRGPLIGPMVICGVLVLPDTLQELERIGVRDSKKLTPSRREKIGVKIESIAEQIVIRSVSAVEIDRLRKQTTLNEVEVREFIEIVKALRPERVYLDAVDVNAERFGIKIGEISGLASRGTVFVSEHKADSTYPIVSAASILAKVQRDLVITGLHDRYGDFGSGYPSDPKTVAFVTNLVRDGQRLPSIVRHSWSSVKRIQDEAKQTSIL
ncbi:MAG: ribonuclease HII [Candidatus Thorarchaeota archaeon]|nr:MAG: ribonuclease HII [Candidatus Thorarchaeota archaeon]